MDLKARISKGYQWRIGFVTLLMLGFTSWFFYDAMVKYPEMKRAYDRYEQVMAEHGDGTHWDAWKPIARANGWKEETPPPEKTRGDIYVQFGCGALTGLIGLFFGVSFVRMYSRWVAADADGVFDSKGRRVAWGDIEKVDKTRWKTKGIAAVRYTTDKGEQKIVLDDWKYEQEPITGIVARVDAHVDPAIIEQPAATAEDAEKIANDIAAAEGEDPSAGGDDDAAEPIVAGGDGRRDA